MLRRTLVLAVAGLAVALAGCTDFQAVSVQQTGPGTVAFHADVQKSESSSNDSAFDGDLLFGIRVPAGTVTPATFTTTGALVTTFHLSPTYAAWLTDKYPGPAGTEWVGYKSETAFVDQGATYAIDLPGLVLPQSFGSSTVELAAMTGGRAGTDLAPTVTCPTSPSPSINCQGELWEGSVELTGPAIEIAAPVDGAVFAVDEEVTVDFSCDASATQCGGRYGGGGTVADGGLLDTSAPGPHELIVESEDAWKQTGHASAAYRVADSVLTVNSAASPGSDGTCDAEECTLHEAIRKANLTDATDVIRFAIPGAGPHVIQPNSALPVIGKPLVIDGYSQAGSARAHGDTPADLRIELRAGASTTVGLKAVSAASSVVVQGLAINGFATQLDLAAPESEVTGTVLGLTAAGTAPSVRGATGVVATGRSTIGGTTAAARNVIAVSDVGVDADGEATIIGNRIGTTPDGQPLALATGVDVTSPATTSRVEDNLVTASGTGVRTDGEVAVGAKDTRGSGNTITAARGIVLETDGGSASHNRLLGSGGAASDHGIDARGDANDLHGNTITGFGGLPIERGDDDVATPNDADDADGIANRPVITAVEHRRDGMQVDGTITGTPDTTYAIDVFRAEDGEPVELLTTVEVPLGASGKAAWTATRASTPIRDGFVTATARRSGVGTSELAAAVEEGRPPVITSITPSDGDTIDEGDLTLSMAFANPGLDRVTSEIDCESDGTIDATSTSRTASRTAGCRYKTEGPVTATVRVHDDDGEATATSTFTVVDVTPTVDLSGSASAAEGATVTYTYTVAPGTADSVVESCGDGADFIDSQFGRTFQCRFHAGPGTSEVGVTVVDDGVTAADTVPVTITNVAPTVTLAGPPDATQGETLTYTYTASDPADELTFAEDCGPGATYVDTADVASFDCTFLARGTNNDVTVTADDGDTTTASTLAIPIANAAPEVVLSGDSSVTQGTTATYTYTAVDPGGDPLGAATESCGTGATYVPDDEDDSFGCRFATKAGSTVSVDIGDGVDATVEQLDVSVVNAAPAVQVSGPATVTQGGSATFMYTVTDGPDDVLGTPAESCGAGATYVSDAMPGSFGCSFTQRGVATVSVTVGDGALDGVDEHAITVTNAPPTVSLSGPTSTEQGKTYTYTYTASDPGGDALTFEEDCGAGDLVDTPATNSFDCTFRARVGSVVGAVADDGEDEGGDTLDVALVNVGPVAGDDTYATAFGTPLTVAAPGVLANDADAGDDAIVAVAGAEPAHGTLVRAADGSFTYTPAAGWSGTDTFTYTAFDDALSSAPATVTIVVARKGADPDPGEPPPGGPIAPSPSPSPSPSPTPPAPPALPGSSPSTSAPGFPRAGGPAGIRVRSLTVSKAGVATLKLENTNAFALRGRAVLRSVGAKPRTLASRGAIALGGKRIATVSLRLDRRTRQALRRGARVRVAVAITVTDTAGRSRSLRVRATLRPRRR